MCWRWWGVETAGNGAPTIRATRSVACQPPPIPVVTLPVPEQFTHVFALTRPLPLQTGQMFSPVPGVPAGASSPGFNGGAPVDVVGFRCWDVLAIRPPTIIYENAFAKRLIVRLGRSFVRGQITLEWELPCRRRDSNLTGLLHPGRVGFVSFVGRIGMRLFFFARIAAVALLGVFAATQTLAAAQQSASPRDGQSANPKAQESVPTPPGTSNENNAGATTQTGPPPAPPGVANENKADPTTQIRPPISERSPLSEQVRVIEQSRSVQPAEAFIKLGIGRRQRIAIR